MTTPEQIIAAVAEFRELIELAEGLRDELREVLANNRELLGNLNRTIDELNGVCQRAGITAKAPNRPTLELVKTDLPPER